LPWVLRSSILQLASRFKGRFVPLAQSSAQSKTPSPWKQGFPSLTLMRVRAVGFAFTSALAPKTLSFSNRNNLL
jgi:hypothetical protein